MLSGFNKNNEDLLYFQATVTGSISLYDLLNEDFVVYTNALSATNIIGVYTGEVDPENTDIKYFANNGKFIYGPHAFQVGDKVINNGGFEIGVAVSDRIVVKY